MALSYSLSSSVLFGALTPSAPAINLPATAVVFSGLLSMLPLPAALSPRLRDAPYGVLSGKSNGVGDAGVGGGGFGDSSVEGTVEMGSSESRGEPAETFAGAVTVSVSESDSPSSQLSATGLDFGFEAGFCGVLVESLRCVRVEAISAIFIILYHLKYQSQLCTFFAGCLVHGRHFVVVSCVLAGGFDQWLRFCGVAKDKGPRNNRERNRGKGEL